MRKLWGKRWVRFFALGVVASAVVVAFVFITPSNVKQPETQAAPEEYAIAEQSTQASSTPATSAPI